VNANTLLRQNRVKQGNHPFGAKMPQQRGETGAARRQRAKTGQREVDLVVNGKVRVNSRTSGRRKRETHKLRDVALDRHFMRRARYCHLIEELKEGLEGVEERMLFWGSVKCRENKASFCAGLGNLSSKNGIRDRFSGSKSRQVTGQEFSGPNFR
jgi:hypothetical protein